MPQERLPKQVYLPKQMREDQLDDLIERSQLRWFGHVSRMPQERLPKQVYLPKQMREDQLDDLKLHEPIILNY